MHLPTIRIAVLWLAAVGLLPTAIECQRPLNSNGTGPGGNGDGSASATTWPMLRTAFHGIPVGANGGGGDLSAASAGAASSNRKIDGRQSALNSLEKRRPPDTGDRPSPGGGGSGGAGAYAFGGSGGLSGMDALRGQFRAQSLGKVPAAADGLGAGPGTAASVAGSGGGGGVGGRRRDPMADLRKDLRQPLDRPADEAFQSNLEKDSVRLVKEVISKQMLTKQLHSLPVPVSDMMDSVLGVKCDFETMCQWKWNDTIEDGFQTVTGAYLTESNRTGMMPGPAADSRQDANGNFLYLRLTHQTGQRSLESPIYSVTQENCMLEMSIHQSGMSDNSMRVVIETQPKRQQDGSWVLMEALGNDRNTWETVRYRIGRVTQDFRVLFEVVTAGGRFGGGMYGGGGGHVAIGHVAIDDLVLRDCFPEMGRNETCQSAQVRCQKNRLAVCLRTVKVCDLDVDCDGREDEQLNCEKIPAGGRCDFEDGWCGWANSGRANLVWERNSGPTPTEKTGPDADHTMQAVRNGTLGHYMFVNMNQHAKDVEMRQHIGFASNAVMNSVVFNPPPAVHMNESSPWHNSCMVRFYVHQFGPNAGSVNLSVVEIGERDNVTTTLWWSSRSRGQDWVRENMIMPNVTGRYYLQFEARMGMRIFSDVAIDDISLSPECFGLNIPVDALDGYNYYDPKLFDNRPAHRDFVNRSIITLSTCGARGKDGPRVDQCTLAYNATAMQRTIRLLPDPPFRGVQVWKVPGENYYTIIAKGAGGGLGSGGVGSSRGARAVSVLELHRDEEMHFLVGQKGEHACIKSMGYREKECDQLPADEDVEPGALTPSKTKQVHHMFIDDGAGGGGGATYAFVLNSMNVAVPLVVAAGGGGLGIGRYLDENEQHGRPATTVLDDHYSGQMEGEMNVTGGAGGGWQAAPYQSLPAHGGAALLEGARGGEPCYAPRGIHGQGGYGGGGGGCMTGGGGGGYAGGDTSDGASNGEGGTSYISGSRSVRGLSMVAEGDNSGAGAVVIIPALATPACGCDYRCVALDEYRSVVACICPDNWQLKKDNLTACEQIVRAPMVEQNTMLYVFTSICVGLAFALSVMVFLLYNRYQFNKQKQIKEKILLDQEVHLARLRNHPNDTLNAFNPNYGADAMFNGTVDVRALPHISRENLRVSDEILGRGAFGEVIVGLYVLDDVPPLPVAIKLLPSLSTKCSEDEFLMEASIMAKFVHPNIVHLIGVCFDKHPRYLVIELLRGGDLKKWLRDSRKSTPKPTLRDLFAVALDVAKGCRYMESRRFIHRDIAARNCLIGYEDGQRVVKIADFGMARDIYRQDYYKKGGRAMLPIKWMPPEAFLDGIFTAKTDVWSYGVLMWEIFSQGILPYASMQNGAVMKYVTNNFRLPQPEGCPDDIYALMHRTWAQLPEDRPTFQQIIEQLDVDAQDERLMSLQLPEFMRTLKMMGENGTFFHVPYNPEECERPMDETDDDFELQPQDYLVPIESSRRREAHKNAAAVAAARIGPASGDEVGLLSIPALSELAPMPSAGGADGTDLPFVCSDPNCTNAKHNQLLAKVARPCGTSYPADSSNGSLETSFSVERSAPNPGDLLPPPPRPQSKSPAVLALSAAAPDADRKLINLDTPQATPTTIKPPMAFGDRETSCNSIATIMLDPANLEQQHRQSTSPYMNVQLQLQQMLPPPALANGGGNGGAGASTVQLERELYDLQQQASPPPPQQFAEPMLAAPRSMAATMAANAAALNGRTRHSGADGSTSSASSSAKGGKVAAAEEEAGAQVEMAPLANGGAGEAMATVAPLAATTDAAGAKKPAFTIARYSKRYKPNENHSEISC